MPEPCVVDTMVLRKANAKLEKTPEEGRQFRKRIELLRRVQRAELQVLISRALLQEYREQVREPRNEYVKSFFEIILDPARHRLNYCQPWSGQRRQARRDCRFPAEDEHVLRTAVLGDERSTIYTEEARMLQTDRCIYRELRVHVRNPVQP